MDEKQLLELLDLPAVTAGDRAGDQEKLLTQAVAYLLETDFPRLCQVLYRVDVDEQLLKQTLVQSEGLPAEIIARLLLERQKQKVALRARYTGASEHIAEEDKW